MHLFYIFLSAVNYKPWYHNTQGLRKTVIPTFRSLSNEWTRFDRKFQGILWSWICIVNKKFTWIDIHIKLMRFLIKLYLKYTAHLLPRNFQEKKRFSIGNLNGKTEEDKSSWNWYNSCFICLISLHLAFNNSKISTPLMVERFNQ